MALMPASGRALETERSGSCKVRRRHWWAAFLGSGSRDKAPREIAVTLGLRGLENSVTRLAL